MDGGAGDAAFAGDLQERHPGVLDKEGQDFLVDLVDVIGCSHRSGRLLFQTNRYKIKKFFYKLFIFWAENLRFNKKTASKNAVFNVKSQAEGPPLYFLKRLFPLEVGSDFSIMA